MKYQPKISYCDFVKVINVSATASPLPTYLFLKNSDDYLKDCEEKADIRRSMITSLGYFREFVNSWSELELSEEMLVDFDSWIVGLPRKRKRGHGWKRSSASMQTLINAVGERNGWLQRRLLTSRSYKKVQRLKRFSAHTLQAISWYEKNAKQIRRQTVNVQKVDGSIGVQKQYHLLNKSLTGYCIHNRLDRLVVILERLNCHGIIINIVPNISYFKGKQLLQPHACIISQGAECQCTCIPRRTGTDVKCCFLQSCYTFNGNEVSLDISCWWPVIKSFHGILIDPTI